MRRTILLTILFLAILPAQVGAQFVGFTSPQSSFQNALLNAVSVATISGTVTNIGQTVHYVVYRTTGTVRTLSIQIEASVNGTNYTRISETATDVGSGALYANASFPFIRVNLSTLTCSGACTLTADYAGSSVTPGPPAGQFTTSGINQKTLATGAAANTTVSYDVVLPAGGAGGIIYFTFSAGPPTGGTVAITSGPDTSHLSSILDTTTLAAVTTTQAFVVNSRPANIARVTYTTPGATAATYDLSYQFAAGGQASKIPEPIIVASPLLGNTVFGDGSDGDVTIAANTNLTRPMQYNNLIINAGFTLQGPAATFMPVVIQVKNTLTISGTLASRDLSVAGGSSVTCLPAGVCVSTAANPGGNVTYGQGVNIGAAVRGGTGGRATVGGCFGSQGTGGGTITLGAIPVNSFKLDPPVNIGDPISALLNALFFVHRGTSFLARGSGGGGGACAVDAGGAGANLVSGQGGVAGAVLYVEANRILINAGGLVISGEDGTNGADGAGATTTRAACAGAGSGGAPLILIYKELTNSGAIRSSGLNGTDFTAGGGTCTLKVSPPSQGLVVQWKVG